MGDLSGHLVEGESRNQTDDPVRNFECHRCKVGIAESGQFRKPINPSSQSIQNASVSHLVESPGVNSEAYGLSSPHRTVVPLEDDFGFFKFVLVWCHWTRLDKRTDISSYMMVIISNEEVGVNFQCNEEKTLPDSLR